MFKKLQEFVRIVCLHQFIKNLQGYVRICEFTSSNFLVDGGTYGRTDVRTDVQTLLICRGSRGPSPLKILKFRRNSD